MNLSIDIGNTKTKAALFKDKELITLFSDFTLKQLTLLNINVANVIISSVTNSTKIWLDYLKKSRTFILNDQLPLPFQNEYLTPKTLGMDRLAAVAGAITFFPNKDLLVIDVGTCITFDFFQNNIYKGGAISPGIQIKFKALHNFTEKLPLVKLKKSANIIGRDTHESILSGVLNGTIAEINYTIEEYKRISDNLAVILCGGDAKLLSKSLKKVNLVENQLVLIGLNEILNYNVK